MVQFTFFGYVVMPIVCVWAANCGQAMNKETNVSTGKMLGRVAV